MNYISSIARWVTTSHGVAFSIAATVAIAAILLFTSGSASAVELKAEGLAGEEITQGQELTFTLVLDIPDGELVPIESLQLIIDGPSPITVTFDPFGNLTSGDPHVTLGICAGCLVGSAEGYGYFEGDRVGYENSTPTDLGYGDRYGVVLSSPLVTKFEYDVTLDTGASPQMATGDYTAKLVMNTGEVANPTIEYATAAFTINSAEPDPLAPTPTVTPDPLAPTPTVTPDPLAPTPTVTPTRPAATATPTATSPVPTATPTATAPALMPTATVTPMPPETVTPMPPEDDEGGVSAGAVIVIVLIVVGLVAVPYGGYMMYRRRQSGMTGP